MDAFATFGTLDVSADRDGQITKTYPPSLLRIAAFTRDRMSSSASAGWRAEDPTPAIVLERVADRCHRLDDDRESFDIFEGLALKSGNL